MPAPSIDAAALLAWLESQMPVTLDLLRRLVDVNSFTANRAGVVAHGRLVAEAFAPLGFEAETVASTQATWGDHLFLERPSARAEAPTIVLVSHLDTVFPPEEEQAHDFRWRVEGERVYGPGVNDIKGGTAMMWLLLSALQRFAPEAFAGVRWLLAFNASEEADSTHFAELAPARIGPAPAAVLVFEACHPVDPPASRTTTLVTRRKGRLAARIECHGRSSHSGAAHPDGANAVVELCRVMASLAQRTDYAREVTWNPAVVTGGTVLNRVPHHALGELEVRAFDPDRLAEARATLLALAGEGDVRSPRDGFACRREVTITGEDPPWPGSERTEDLAALWQRAAERVGRQVKPGPRGGLSDANRLWSPNVPVLDGLGPEGLHAHCSQRSRDGSSVPEWMNLASFAPLAAMHTLAVAELAAAAGAAVGEARLLAAGD